MEQYYTDERNVQILIALLKSHGIKRIVASPGSTNVTFVGSLQQKQRGIKELLSTIISRWSLPQT